MIEIVEANTVDLIAKVKALFQEYAESLGFDLGFQGFDQELVNFPAQYSPPMGRLFWLYREINLWAVLAFDLSRKAFAR